MAIRPWIAKNSQGSLQLLEKISTRVNALGRKRNVTLYGGVHADGTPDGSFWSTAGKPAEHL